MTPDQILNSLVTLSTPIESLMPELEKLQGMDPGPEMITVTRAQISDVLERSVRGEISFESLQNWAIEMSRFSTTHLVFARQDEGAIRPVLFELSESERELSPFELGDLLRQLS